MPSTTNPPSPPLDTALGGVGEGVNQVSEVVPAEPLAPEQRFDNFPLSILGEAILPCRSRSWRWPEDRRMASAVLQRVVPHKT